METKPMKILIADDEDGLRISMAGILEMEGHTVVTADDGYKAVERVKEESFDIAFLDIKMPGINGVETFKEIKKYSPETVVIMMTAFALGELIKEAISEGAFACISKPFDMEKIINTIHDVSSKPFVVVIDDDPQLCSLLYDRLQAKGFKIVTRTSGYDGIELIRRKVPDVVLLDVMMEGMDGIATLGKLKEMLGKDCPKTVIMSSYDVPAKFNQARDLGAIECLRKPLDFDRLQDIIYRSIGKNTKPKILIVDDDRHICDSLRDNLLSRGYDVEVAYSGNEVIEKLKDEASQSVILDLRAPEVDSLDIYEKIKQTNASAGVVFISGDANNKDESTKELIKKNNLIYLHKPFEPDQLMSLLESISEIKQEKQNNQ